MPQLRYAQLDTDAVFPLQKAVKTLTKVGDVFRKVNLKPETMVRDICRCDQKIYEEANREIRR